MRILLALCMSAAALAADADLILHGGKVLTVNGSFAVEQAVAIKGSTIVAVGRDVTVLGSERGAKTLSIDLKGRTLVPGLIDSHVHPLGAALSEYRQPLPSLRSFADVRAFLTAQSRTTPKGKWIVVPRTFPTRLAEMRMPTRELLDVVRDHPVMFDASYVVIVNSYALKLCGITRETRNPPGGEIVKDARGEPNGILKNGQSLLKGLEEADRLSDSEQLTALEAMLGRYASAGLTSVVDRAVGPSEIDLYDRLRKRGPLPVRVALTWRMPTDKPADELVRQIQAAPYSRDAGDDWLRFAIFKVTLDGGMTIGTAYQRQPYGPFGVQLYGKTDSSDRGQLFVPPDKLLAVLRAARDKGWGLTAHSQGGGAIDALLDAFEALDKERAIEPSRSHLMHASFQSPDAIQRAKRLGILADVQGAWLHFDGPALEKVFTPEGMKYFFPLKSYRDAGVLFASGSDHMTGHDRNTAVNPYNPFLGMWNEVSRRTTSGQVLNANEKISREDALRSYTIWGAHLQGQEKRKGSIEPGKLADMVVLDRDYLTCPEEQIKDIQPAIVILDGKVVRK